MGPKAKPNDPALMNTAIHRPRWEVTPLVARAEACG